MKRNGRSNQSRNPQRGSSGLLTGLISLAGGVGLGAGLLYLLDPDSGERRRRRLLSGASEFASSAGSYAGEALGSVGSKVGGLVSGAMGSVRDYAGDKVESAREYAEEKLCGETRAQHRLGVSICALSSMALGAALMYAFDPALGRIRRRNVREQAGNLASQAGDAIRSGVEQVREQVGYRTSDTVPPMPSSQPTPFSPTTM